MAAGPRVRDDRAGGRHRAHGGRLDGGPGGGQGGGLRLLLLPGALREIPLRLIGDPAGVLERRVAREVGQRPGGAGVGVRGGRGAGRGQCAGGRGRLDRELPPALQDAGALGLRVGVPAQQRGVFAPQPGQLDALAAQLRLQAGADLPRLLQVRFELRRALLGAPLVARAGARQLGDATARIAVPAAHEDGAGDGGRGSGRDQRAQDHGFGRQPGSRRTGHRRSGDGRRRKDSVQWWRMAMASTGHGPKFTVCAAYLGSRPAICARQVTRRPPFPDPS